MAFDGLFIHHLIGEIAPEITGGRIDKIHQPEKDELSMSIRGRDKNLTLFISIESAMPYFTLTHSKKENPQAPPMFCMLMRKHLAGGRIMDFYQLGNERIIVLEVESKNELGELERKKLIAEIMGKHSNLILTKEDFTVIDSIKRVTPDMSRIRTILPGLKYEAIPSDKIKLSESESLFLPSLSKLVAETPSQKSYKALYMLIEGMSPISSKWVLNHADLSFDTPIGQLTSPDLEKIITGLKLLETHLANEAFIYYDQYDIPRDIYFLGDLLGHNSKKVFTSFAAAVDEYYGTQNKQLKNHQRANDLKKVVSGRLERAESKLKKIELELETAENSEQYKIYGELILANIYRLHKGDNTAIVENYYESDTPEITIPLDVRLDPSENAQRYFKKYNKLKTATSQLKIQIKETKEEAQYLDQVLTLLEHIEEPSEIADIKQELVEEGFIRARVQPKKSKTSKELFRRFVSTDGFEILVGKNNKQNDQLTLKVASNKDIWLHTKIIPGSHVIIRTEGAEPPESTLNEAAVIAAYHSKARESSNVPVDYTLVKHVTKPNGAKPGMVIYVQNKTLFVTPDEVLVNTLKKQ